MVRIHALTLGCAFLLADAAPAGTKLFQVLGDGSGDLWGHSVDGAGDVNQDGYRDFIVGARDGYVRVLSGKDASLIHQWTKSSDIDAVAGVGDVNGDGYDDVAMGGANIVWVYSGKTGQLYWSAVLATGGDFGFSIAGAGDVNADGYDDVIVGDPYSDAVNTDGGRAYVLSGLNAAILYTLNGASYQGYLGYSVSTAGDINRDGYDDVLVGEPHLYYFVGYTGAIYVYSGKDGAVLGSLTGPGGWFGFSVSGGQDTNQDGWPDFVVGTPYLFESVPGKAFLYSGKTFSVLHQWVGTENGDLFGWSVSLSGDVNGGGFPDVIVGAPEDSSIYYQGTATIFSGSSGTELTKYFGNGCDRFGDAVSDLGDLNHDGHADVIVADPSNDSQLTNRGDVFVFSGKDYDASWINYGSGWPGTNGVPSITLSADPVICSTIDLQIGNSRGSQTVGSLFVGLAEGSIPTNLGGTLLVAPPWTIVTLPIPAAGVNLPVQVLCDSALLGLSVYLQILENDGGASSGVSFSKGLKVVHGL
ncbi:MAG: integrin alpha [Planctomycetota bacterium]